MVCLGVISVKKEETARSSGATGARGPARSSRTRAKTRPALSVAPTGVSLACHRIVAPVNFIPGVFWSSVLGCIDGDYCD